MKSGNAEDQQARIASALDRLAELVGLAMGPMDHSEMPKGWSSMAGFVPALRQRCCPWGEVRFGATESDGRLSGVRFFQSVAFADAKGSGVGFGWLDWFVG
ncbi:hypothetical protein [Thalassospira xiamenensis]|uniref:hypothetical protein n=1 Tax=Thalassospira xiamenensis TaxID=220697 RepID=UPI001FFFCA7F|nr:hypothetical protein [Thalassospira xiamenensis]MCK2165361.1 hypothetical protein [Thalassospira xiamenensis]